MADRRIHVLVVSITVLVLASIFVGLYLISCIFVVRRLKLPDYLMLLAWIIDFAFVFSLLYAVGKDFGLHEHDIKPGNEVPVNKSLYVFNILYKVFYRANYVLLFIIIAVGVALTILQIFHFHLEQTNKDCTNIILASLSSSPYNIATDIAILFMPIPLLTRIHLPFRQRVILVVTFGAGILVILIDVVRIAFFPNTAKTQLQVLNSYYTEDITNQDYTWYAAYTLMLSVLEVNMTIICACIPSLRPLATRFSPFLIHNPQQVASRHAGRKSTLQGADGSDSKEEEAPSEMIHVLTSSQEKEKETRDTRNRYPQIKLLNLLNLRPTRMLRLNAKQSIPPNILVTILIFIWRTAFGFLEVLSLRIGLVHLGPWRTYTLEGAYWLGYLLGPLPRLGFTAAFMSGLYIYALGTFLFWLSAVLVSFPIFFASNLIIGSGLGILEMTAKLFIAICGPLEYAEVRLCTSQGFQGLGSLFARLLAGKLLLPRVGQISEVISIQWTFLGITFLVMLLVAVFYYLPVPEALDQDLQELARRRGAVNKAKVLGVPVIYVTIILGVWSQFFQEAGQEVHASKLTDVDIDSIGSTVWIFARFLAAFIIWMGLKPRWVLIFSFTASIIVSVVCLKTTGVTSIAMAILFWFTAAPAFPIIYAMSMRGMGVHTKTASAFMAASLSNGFMAFLARYAVKAAIGEPNSYIIVAAFWGTAAIFPIYLNLVPAAKRQVDPIKNEYLMDYDSISEESRRLSPNI
ncbi:putative glucose/galactose transporter [Talaromyces proteolyticus]|uniref:Glucose/galactose transporter n=1 Tax=Talaromyces proteolyticus TaxID=1131652 RepID=A0AAD4L7C9_9EURO|nr:putative glucose/galactose transporter [Talaromyces proteolyticus]KAH8705319.1 putative glucose/galactose transporter [Talaromyces proteolyticus]